MSAFCGEMSGSSPDPDAVTASGGIWDCDTWSNASICFCRAAMAPTSSGLVGPRLLAADSLPLQRQSPSLPSWPVFWTLVLPVAVLGSLVALDGRGWNHCASGAPVLGLTNSWHSRLDPTTWPL